MRGWEITRKDLHLLVRDRRALAVLLVLPLIFVTLIGLTTGQLLGWAESNRMIQVVAVDNVDYEAIGSARPETTDEQARKLARNLVVKILNRLQRRDGVEVALAADRDEALNRVNDMQAGAALVFGPEFFDRVRALELSDLLAPGQGPPAEELPRLDMRLIGDQVDSSTLAIIGQVVDANTAGVLAPYVTCRTDPTELVRPEEIRFPDDTPAVTQMTTRRAVYDGIQRMLHRDCDWLQTEKEGPPLDFLPPDEVPETPPDSRVYQKIVPSYTVLFVFFLVNIMARSFIQERDVGTLHRLRMAPLRPSSLLAGKTLPFFVISVVQTILLFLCGRFLFGMSWGTVPWLLVPVVLGTSLSATGLGLLVGTWVRTDAQVSAFANTVVITMAGISGCFMPREWLPQTMRTVSLATPHAWALIAYDEILTAARPDWSVVLRCSGILIAFAVAYFTLGCLRFGRHD